MDCPQYGHSIVAASVAGTGNGAAQDGQLNFFEALDSIIFDNRAAVCVIRWQTILIQLHKHRENRFSLKRNAAIVHQVRRGVMYQKIHFWDLQVMKPANPDEPRNLQLDAETLPRGSATAECVTRLDFPKICNAANEGFGTVLRNEQIGLTRDQSALFAVSFQFQFVMGSTRHIVPIKQNAFGI